MHKFKEMLMEKLDQLADTYKNKDPREIPAAAIDAWGKMTDMLVDLSAVEGMDEYGDYLDKRSGERGRSPRTGRFISRDMDGMSRRMYRGSYNDHYDDGSYGESYGDGHEMETELEEMANNRALPSSKREAARKMLAEIRKGDL